MVGNIWRYDYPPYVLFVLFFSVSDVNVALFEDLKNGFESDVLNTDNGTPISMLANRLDSVYDHPEYDNEDVEVELLKRGINIRLASSDLFRSGDATLSRER